MTWMWSVLVFFVYVYQHIEKHDYYYHFAISYLNCESFIVPILYNVKSVFSNTTVTIIMVIAKLERSVANAGQSDILLNP